MAARTILQTDTLETFRLQFNALSSQDFGDIATLSGAISATNIVDAMNETIGIATSTAGFTIEDSSSTQQIIGGGDTLKVLGTSNEIEAVVSATDTLTIGLPNNVTIGNNLTVANDLTVSNTANIGSLNTATISSVDSTTVTVNDNFSVSGNSTLGTIFINGNTINTTDSTTLTLGTNTVVDGSFGVVGGSTLGNVKLGIPGQYDLTSTSGFFSVDATLYLAPNRPLVFEGATADDFETTLRPVDATADRLIFIPNENGTIITTGSIDAITESMMANDAIGSAELKSVVQLIIYNSSGTPLKTLYGAGA
jgi:hypothetical protein